MALRFLRSWIAATIGAAAIGLAMSAGAEDVPTKSSRAASGYSRVSGRSSGGVPSIQTLESRLKEILEKQQQILTRLDEVMAELQIVKIRATVR